MQQIEQSRLDAVTKQSLKDLFDCVVQRTVTGQTGRSPRGEVVDAIANALVDLASAGQRDPEQLIRYAEYRASIV